MKIFAVLLLVVAYATSENVSEEGDLYEGDIILDPDQINAIDEQESKASTFAAMKAKHWKTNGKNDVIKYYIDTNLVGETAAVDAITAAVSDYHKYTCIRFERVDSKPSGSHMRFFKGGGCYSYVGKQSSGNPISLGSGCWRKGTAMHEMGHALGFFHEQSRPDRDDHVEIIFKNIRSGMESNFKMHKTDRIDSLGSPYDYKSMMHYGKNYFAKGRDASGNRLITIRTKDAKYQNVIGQRGGFSQGDIEQFNKMYNCCDSTGGTTTTRKPQTTKQPQITNLKTTKRPRTTSASKCVDKKFTCGKHWFYLCETNAYVKKYCLKTCNRC